MLRKHFSECIYDFVMNSCTLTFSCFLLITLFVGMKVLVSLGAQQETS